MAALKWASERLFARIEAGAGTLAERPSRPPPGGRRAGAGPGTGRVRPVDRAVAAGAARAVAPATTARRSRNAGGRTSSRSCATGSRRASSPPWRRAGEVADRLVAMVDGLGVETALGYRWTSPRAHARAPARVRGRAARRGATRPSAAHDRRGGGTPSGPAATWWPSRSPPSGPRSPSACRESTRCRSGTACEAGRCARSACGRSCCSGFAADGYARASGRPAPLVLSTGPGALNALTALMEAASAHVPVVAISSQEPRALLGPWPRLPARAARSARRLRARRQARRARRERRGAAGAAGRGVARSRDAADRARLRRDPGRRAGGPDARAVARARWTATRRRPRAARPEAIAEAARLLAAAERPVLWAGGGVERSGAWGELAALAERLDAPVATTYMGKGALPGRPSAERRLGLRRGGLPGTAHRRRRRARGGHGARRGDDGPVPPRVRRPADPPRRRAGAHRGDLPRARPRR